MGVSSAVNGQLQAELAPGEDVAWQSIVLDAPPAGAYRLSMAGELAGAASAIVRASVRSASDPDKVLGGSEVDLGPGLRSFSIDWVSDGSTPCRLEFRVRSTGEPGRSTFKEMKFSRQWPLTQGALRFREMSALSK
jgi:hypothetical protein